MSFNVGKLFHVIHMSDAVAPLDDWYDDVFFPRRGMMDGNHAPSLKRDASLLVIADIIIEPMAPSQLEGADTMPAGRFFGRFGRHWHSLAWYVDDVGSIWDGLHAHGIRMVTDASANGGRPEGGALYTHPKDSLVQLEFYQRPASDLSGREGTMLPDPRLFPGWSSDWWATNHPLGLERMAYATVVTGNMDRAHRVFVDFLHGTLLAEDESKLTGTRNAYVAIGPETVVELSTPIDSDSLAAKDFQKNGDACHAVAFKVRDLDQAGAYLASKQIGVVARDEDTIIADPADTFGAPFRFTVASIHGDPRDRST